jgi:hypothetical protein
VSTNKLIFRRLDPRHMSKIRVEPPSNVVQPKPLHITLPRRYDMRHNLIASNKVAFTYSLSC